MRTKAVSIELFKQLIFVCEQMNDEAFTEALSVLSGSTIGQHMRHIIEFYVCLKNASGSGKVSYDGRAHDRSLESSVSLTKEKINELTGWLEDLDVNQELELEVSYPLSGLDSEVMNSSILREIVYNIEHMIHHMAIIKIGLSVSESEVKLPAHFGVAQSTVVYKEGA